MAQQMSEPIIKCEKMEFYNYPRITHDFHDKAPGFEIHTVYKVSNDVINKKYDAEKYCDQFKGIEITELDLYFVSKDEDEDVVRYGPDYRDVTLNCLNKALYVSDNPFCVNFHSKNYTNTSVIRAMFCVKVLLGKMKDFNGNTDYIAIEHEPMKYNSMKIKFNNWVKYAIYDNNRIKITHIIHYRVPMYRHELVYKLTDPNNIIVMPKKLVEFINNLVLLVSSEKRDMFVVVTKLMNNLLSKIITVNQFILAIEHSLKINVNPSCHALLSSQLEECMTAAVFLERHELLLKREREQIALHVEILRQRRILVEAENRKRHAAYILEMNETQTVPADDIPDLIVPKRIRECDTVPDSDESERLDKSKYKIVRVAILKRKRD